MWVESEKNDTIGLNKVEVLNVKIFECRFQAKKGKYCHIVIADNQDSSQLV